MDWINSVVCEIHKKLLGAASSASAGASVGPSIEERRIGERVQLFQWRLSELDRRLSQLR